MRKIVHKLSAITFIVVIVCLLSGAAVMAAQSVIPPPSIVNWWPGDGNAQDFMGGKHGILMNGAGFAGGKVGQAFSFDGINDYVSVGRTDFVNALTIEAWVYPKSFGAYSTIYARWYDGSWPDRGVVFQIKSNTHLRLGVINDSNILDGAYTFQVNQWYHVAGTWDGSTSRVYVNGVQVGNRSTSGTFTNQNINAAIGVDPVPAQYYFNGRIGAVRRHVSG
ncbi:MAG: LamG domain-containing protein [candidate division KSB1 bacterium]|nr:LamG domain-containing protein [candidate division KSB1 bacterium]